MPADEMWALGPSALSPALDEVACAQGAETPSFDRAAGMIQRCLGIRLPAKTVERITEAIGAVAEAEQRAAMVPVEAIRQTHEVQAKAPVLAEGPPLPENAPTLLVGADGGRLHAEGDWREVKVGVEACYARSTPSASTGEGEKMARVLVVDDDQDVRLVLARYLERDGHEVASAVTAQAALAHLMLPVDVDVAILDLTLPDMDGLQVLSRIRASQPELPVLVLTARGDEGDRILGLGLGADDYVVKPFSPREVCLRIAGLLRRTRTTQSGEENPIRFGPIEMRLAEHRVIVDGQDIELTPKEFELLHMFLRNPHHVLSKPAILSALWPEGYVSDHVVDVHLASLRRKLRGVLEVTNVRGIGYRLGGGA